MRFMGCFGGAAAAVADETVVVMARHRSRQRRGAPFQGRFVSGEKGNESPWSSKQKVLFPWAKRSTPQRLEVVEDAFDMVAFREGKLASVPSSSALSSLDSACSSSCSSSRSSTSSASSVEEATPPPAKPAVGQRSPAAGAAAVLLCLVMVVFCGRFAATLLAPAVLYLFPRRWPARIAKAERAGGRRGGVDTAPVASWREEFLVRNRKK